MPHRTTVCRSIQRNRRFSTTRSISTTVTRPAKTSSVFISEAVPAVLAFVLLAGEAGLRRDEIIAFDLTDADFRRGQLTIVWQVRWRPHRDSNSGYRRERAVSWASRRWGRGCYVGVLGVKGGAP